MGSHFFKTISSIRRFFHPSTYRSMMVVLLWLWRCAGDGVRTMLWVGEKGRSDNWPALGGLFAPARARTDCRGDFPLEIGILPLTHPTQLAYPV
ncbi:hypothetical protein BCR43DRAFT_271581 [Syncephalastrum racemosum]|uniref:Secreted protein n=1 Tax=Syncephalastrum racemosum TaxID=13706 RepID=A0A1X2HBY2_SYNRA|nr:hypothetical protein BCR43DRAFT_271581 [Syncephalastrum racemosum]